LTCRKVTTSFDTLCRLYIEMNLRSRYAKAWWFPWTDEVHIWEVNEANESEICKYVENNGELTSVSSSDESMNNTIDKVIEKMGADTNDYTHSGKQFETVARFKSVTDVTGNIYQILCKGIPSPQINCEVAIPLENMIVVLEALHEWQKTHMKALHYPFVLRCTGESKAFLSPAYLRKVCYIGFLVYLGKDGSYVGGSMEVMRELQELLRGYGGIPHLGKHFVREVYEFERLLPEWERFKEVRRKMDPEGKFENKFVRELFCKQGREVVR